MKSIRIPLFLLFLLYICFLGYWAWSGTQLPDRVATHFDGPGQPNGWMSRANNQAFTLVFGLAFPLFIVGLTYATRFLPSSLVNIPNRQYWLVPERKQETSDYLVRHSLWLACLLVGFVTGIQYSIVQANKQSPPHLSSSTLLQVLAPFLAAVVVWLVVLFHHFRRR